MPGSNTVPIAVASTAVLAAIAAATTMGLFSTKNAMPVEGKV